MKRQAEFIEKLNKRDIETKSPLQGVSFVSPSKKGSPRKPTLQNNSIINYFARVSNDVSENKSNMDIEQPDNLANTKVVLEKEALAKSEAEIPIRTKSRSIDSYALSNTSLNKIKVVQNSTPSSPSKSKSIKGQSTTSKFDFAKNPVDFSGNKPGDPGYNPTQLYISEQDWKSMTPAKRQYWEYKQTHFDEIVFFQQGDFFNLFGPDALLGIEKFGLFYNKVLDSVGFNRKQVRDWAAKFCNLGYKVTIYEQSSTAITEEEKNLKKKKKGTEDRDVTNKLTAGTMDDYQMFETNDYSSRYLMCIQEQQDKGSSSFGVNIIDTSTFEWRITSFQDDERFSQLETLILQNRPTEILYDRLTLSSKAKKIIDVNLPNVSLTFVTFPDELGAWNLIEDNNYFNNDIPDVIKSFKSDPLAITSFGGVITYFKSLTRTSIEASDERVFSTLDVEIMPKASYNRFNVFDQKEYMILDAPSLVNLEILENNEDGTSRGTLFDYLDNCVTPYGKRMLRKWICYPLLNIDKIRARQDAVQYFIDNGFITDSIQRALKKTKDVERLITRMLTRNVSIHLFLEFLDSITIFEELIRTEKSYIEQEEIAPPPLLVTLLYDLPNLGPFLEKFAFDREETKQSGIIRPFQGTNSIYDEAMSKISAIEVSLDQTLLNIKRKHSIAAEYHQSKTESYTIKVKTSQNIPSNWVKVAENKQGLRYSCPDVNELVDQLQEAKSNLELICKGLLMDYLDQFKKDFDMCSLVIRNLAQVDVLMSFGCNYNQKSSIVSMCRPTLLHNRDASFEAIDMTHPYIRVANGTFIPNDVQLGKNKSKIMLITGPNMGGKSALLRQVCISCILAQIGCFVLAFECTLSPVDRIFTRLGARDNIIAGKSTFLIEIEETSKILKHASDQSLIILDELGRGTSTFDGYSIAYAVLKYLEDRKSMVLFSTHYHKLTQEFDSTNGKILQYHMSCREVDGEMVFLYKLKEGSCPSSFGLNVASMANIPNSVIERAKVISSQFETYVKNRLVQKSNPKLKTLKDICLRLKSIMK